MYSVSENYKEAIRKPVRRDRISGRLTTSKGKTLAIDDSNLIRGSVEIDNRCVNGSEFMYGAVYAGELSFTLITDTDRYSLYDAAVELSYELMLADGTYEAVPLGKWFVSEAVRHDKTVSITALDAMTALDVDASESIVASTFDMLSRICKICGLEMAQDREEIEALTNGKNMYSLQPERVDTYRDAVAYLATVTCTFAAINRAGLLELRRFSDEATDTLPADARNETRASDFLTYYRGITGRFLAEENFYPYSYNLQGVTSGLVLDFGDVPIVQGLPEFKNKLIAAMGETLKAVNYTPATVKWFGDPAHDLGDMLQFETADGTQMQTLVCKHYWGYRSGSTLEGVGANPRLANVKDRTNKQLVNMEAVIATKDIIVYKAVGTRAATVGAEAVPLVTMQFAATSETTAVYLASVPFALDLDGLVELTFTVDQTPAPERTLRKYLPAGEHFLTVHDTYACGENERKEVILNASVQYVESAERADRAATQTAQGLITAWIDFDQARAAAAEAETDAPEWVAPEEVEPDKTAPTMTVAKNTVKATVFAQGLAAQAAGWDGTITTSEDIAPFEIVGGRLTLAAKIAGKPESMAQQKPIAPGGIASEATGAFAIAGGRLTLAAEIAEAIEAKPCVTRFALRASGADYDADLVHVENDTSFSLETSYEYPGYEVATDTGKITEVDFDTSGMARVDGLEVVE